MNPRRKVSHCVGLASSWIERARQLAIDACDTEMLLQLEDVARALTQTGLLTRRDPRRLHA